MKSKSKHERKRGAKKQATTQAAMELLCGPGFFFRAGQKLQEMGVTGEKKNRLALLLAALTKDLESPVSVLMKGPTASGKNTAVAAVVSLMPPELVIRRASLTRKALAYGSEDLTGKVFYLYEYRGGHDAQYLTRELQSEGSLEHEHTVVAGNDRSTKVARRVGAPVFLSTTTETRVFAEDETRFLSLRVDESEDLTREVLRTKFQPTAPKQEQPKLEVWRAAVRLLAADARAFRFPEWFKCLAEKLPAAQTRARRDAGRFLSLLMAVAAVRSFSDGRRDTKAPIEITIADYCVAFEILNEAFAFTYSGAHPNAVEVAEVVRKLYGKAKRPIALKEIAEHKDWEYSLVYKWVNAALENKLIKREDGTREKNVKRFLPKSSVQTKFLPDPTLVLEESQKLGTVVRYVDPLTGQLKTLRKALNNKDDDE